jgi:hypothetical protein
MRFVSQSLIYIYNFAFILTEQEENNVVNYSSLGRANKFLKSNDYKFHLVDFLY